MALISSSGALTHESTPARTLTTAVPAITIGTSLPGSPADGDRYCLVDSTTVPTYRWYFSYNSSSASTYKWEFIGGNPLTNYVDAHETSGSLTATNLTTVGPSITVSRAGDYSVRANCAGSNGNAEDSYMIVVNGAGTANIMVNSPLGYTRSGTLNYLNAMTITGETTGRAASDIIRMKYYVGGNTGHWSWRSMWVCPIRVI